MIRAMGDDRVRERETIMADMSARQLRDRAFGTVSEKVRTGDLTRGEAVQVMQRAVEQCYPDCRCAFGHGSALTGRFSEYSDLDVVVFMEAGNYFEVRCINFEGYLIETQVYSLDAFDVFAKMSRAAGLSIGMMAGRGEVLVDRHGDAHALLQRITDMFHAGPDPASANLLATMRVKLTNLVIDLLEADAQEERIACGLSLFDLLNKAKFLTLQSWGHAGKWIPRTIGAHDREYFPAMVAAYEQIFRGNPEPLAQMATNLLDELGGPHWKNYQARLQVMPDLVTGGALAATAALART
jgi:hypothetical protein